MTAPVVPWHSQDLGEPNKINKEKKLNKLYNFITYIQYPFLLQQKINMFPKELSKTSTGQEQDWKLKELLYPFLHPKYVGSAPTPPPTPIKWSPKP